MSRSDGNILTRENGRQDEVDSTTDREGTNPNIA